MDHINQNEQDEPFSDDPDENLSLENELLKIKLQAEWGAKFGGDGNISPEIENAFLKNVQQFETAWESAEQVKLYDSIGRPQFKSADELQPAEIPAALQHIEDILAKHHIALDVLGTYEPAVIYRFITEELFEYIGYGMGMPGMTTHYIYEEFHPNHRMDIEKSTHDFFKDWFNGNFNEYSWELASEIVVPDGRIFKKPEAIKKLNNYLSCFTEFSDYQFDIAEIHFQWENDKGTGHSEGSVFYKSTLESGEIITTQGPFKLYMSNEYGGWDIFSFVVPGFAW